LSVPPDSAEPSAAAPLHADDDHPALAAANARAGLGLFFLYLALYTGFVGLNAFAPQRMARPALGGLNLALLYGLVLIAAAFVLALVYMALCRLAHGRHRVGGEDR